MIFVTDNMKNFRPPPCAGVQNQSALSAQNINIDTVYEPRAAVGVPEIKLRC